jgi:YVTN family beta-propeller protein
MSNNNIQDYALQNYRVNQSLTAGMVTSKIVNARQINTNQLFVNGRPVAQTSFNTGVTPAGLAVTPDGNFLYVANNNNYTITGQDSVSVYDLQKQTLLTTITDSSFNQPYTITMNAAGTIAYVTNSNSSTITMISVATNSVIGLISGFDGPSGMAINPNGNLAYVNNYGYGGGVGSGNGHTISIVSLLSNSIVGTINVNLAPAAVALSPNGMFLYSVNYVDGNNGTGTVNVIMTSNNTIIATIPGFSGPFAIAINPAGTLACVTNFGSNNFTPFGTTVSILDLMANTISSTVTVGIQPSGIAIDAAGKFAYVSNYNTLYNGSALVPGAGSVQIINLATRQVLATMFTVGQSPNSIALSPSGNFGYVSNFTSNTVTVINLSNVFL